MDLIKAIIIAIVEGITEFLPISSTGHMIITSSIMGIEKDDFTKLMEVAIQFGAILAVIVLYRNKFFAFKDWKFYLKLIIGVIPALVLGYAFSDKIDELLESPLTVAITLILGGIVLVFIDGFFKTQTISTEPEISNKNALSIGFWQTIAMIPGVSRSAASIIGGMQQKLTRELAAEFSFFLAVPTMAAATLYSLFLKHYHQNGVEAKGYELILSSTQNLTAFIVGNVVAFVVALVAIKFLIRYLQKHGFKVFGYYRVVIGIVIIVFLKYWN
ncbi:MAG: undecaprenyl-diphosphate phosphatase [Saprospiraceae bacterium]